MPKDITADARIGVIPGESVALPSHDFIANAQMTREGADLRLTLPDGHSVVVDGYFAQNPPPDLVAADGARLTPHLVDAFLLPAHPGEYAAAGNSANDASPVGKVSAVAGEAHIIHADGTQVPAAVGTQLHQGDVIETAKTGAVNIIFADNTAFAVGENARMSVDKFIYDADQHNGASFFSMLQGAFVYTSGLIGKADPGNVNIETPIGTIGIRGTAAVGDNEVIAVWDGAIAVNNHGNEVLLNRRFEVISFNSDHTPQEVGMMDPKQFIAKYSTLFSLIDRMWLDPLIDIYDLQHHDLPQHLQLHMPTIHDGKLELHQGDGTQTAAWGFQDGQQLDGGIYNLFPGGVVQPLSPLPIPGGGGGANVPVVGGNTNDTFYINEKNTVLGGGPELLFDPAKTIDGRGGFDTVIVGGANLAHTDIDFSLPIGTIKNVERFILGESEEIFGHHMILGIEDVFNITGAGHTLEIIAHNAGEVSFVDVIGGAVLTTTVNAANNTTTYTGDVSGQQVTFIIFTGNGDGQSTITVTNVV
jgi:hypothetical protein